MTSKPQTLLNPATFPVDPATCKPIYPDAYLKVNPILNAIHDHRLLTAWSDKQPIYERPQGCPDRGDEGPAGTLAAGRGPVPVPAPARGRAEPLVRGSGDNAPMRIERSRENVFTVTATSQELSALVAGARMALEAMRGAPEPPPREALEILERVLREFDQARERLARTPAGDG